MSGAKQNEKAEAAEDHLLTYNEVSPSDGQTTPLRERAWSKLVELMSSAIQTYRAFHH